MIPGFKTRLVEEMRDLLASPKHKYQDSLHIDDILAHKLPCKANYAAWDELYKKSSSGKTDSSKRKGLREVPFS